MALNLKRGKTAESVSDQVGVTLVSLLRSWADEDIGQCKQLIESLDRDGLMLLAYALLNGFSQVLDGDADEIRAIAQRTEENFLLIRATHDINVEGVDPAEVAGHRLMEFIRQVMRGKNQVVQHQPGPWEGAQLAGGSKRVLTDEQRAEHRRELEALTGVTG